MTVLRSVLQGAPMSVIDLDQRVNRAQSASAHIKHTRTDARNQFFHLGETHYLVDLPGYGYANALGSGGKMAKTSQTISLGPPIVAPCFVLIDSRHGIKSVDQQILSLLDTSAVTFQVVLTKADKIKEAERTKTIEQVSKALQAHPAAFPEILMTSSEKGWGIPYIAQRDRDTFLRATFACLDPLLCDKCLLSKGC